MIIPEFQQAIHDAARFREAQYTLSRPTILEERVSVDITGQDRNFDTVAAVHCIQLFLVDLFPKATQPQVSLDHRIASSLRPTAILSEAAALQTLHQRIADKKALILQIAHSTRNDVRGLDATTLSYRLPSYLRLDEKPKFNTGITPHSEFSPR